MKIIVKWEVEDGYVGKSRPQSTIVDTDHHFWDSLNDEEKRQLIEECVQEDYEQKISFSISDYGI
jgi:hypothetical protein